jgi:hypothetical protein
MPEKYAAAVATLGNSGRALWDSVNADYELNAFEQRQLLEVARCADTLDGLDADIRENGVMREAKPNPAVVEARQMRIAFARLCAALALPNTLPRFTQRSTLLGSMPTASARLACVHPPAAIVARSRSLAAIGTFYPRWDVPKWGTYEVPTSWIPAGISAHDGPNAIPDSAGTTPDRSGELEPTPVDGCAGCAELAKVREWARASNDQTTVTDCNVLMARHPSGH